MTFQSEVGEWDGKWGSWVPVRFEGSGLVRSRGGWVCGVFGGGPWLKLGFPGSDVAQKKNPKSGVAGGRGKKRGRISGTLRKVGSNLPRGWE